MKIRMSLIFILFTVLIAANGQERTRVVPDEWRTLAESTDYRKTPRYAETVEFAKKLAAASPLISYSSIGKSGEGRDIPLLIASKNGESEPAAAKRSGKAIVLVQAAIHSGESDGKDAGLALLRDIAITGTKKELLDNAVILFIPIYNVDGHEMFNAFNRINQNGPEEMGFRATSSNLNLNRDYLKADAPETRAWLGFWDRWDPDFFIDCHVTDGADYRYNITWEYPRHSEISPVISRWMKAHFEERVVEAVEKRGNLLSPYLQFADRSDPTKGIFSFIATPRFATGYTPLRNRVGLLIEAHSIKDYRSRVRGTYDLLDEMIAEIGRSKESLAAANRAADEEAVSRGKCEGDPAEFPLAQTIERSPVDHKFKGYEITFAESEVSGAMRVVYGTEPVDLTVPWFDKTVVSKSATAPCYYLVPPQWRSAVEVIETHGVQFTRLDSDREFEIESYVLENPAWAREPFEGRHTLRMELKRINEIRLYPKGSLLIPVSQVRSAVIMHLLEPDSPDSLAYWGFFDAIFERKEYGEGWALEELGAKMLKEDPELRAEFEELLKDEAFASDPRARLNFFYHRSPYFENRVGYYPVGRLMSGLGPPAE